MSSWSFRARLVLSFATAALLPLTVIAIFSSSLVRSAFQRDAAARVAQAGSLLDGQLTRDGVELRDKLEALAEDYALREKLYQYAEKGRRKRAVQTELINWLEKARKERGLPLVQLTAADGTIVASGHEKARFDQMDPRTVELAARFSRAPVLALEQGVKVKGLALKVAVDAGEGDSRLVLSGGLLINEEFLRRLPVALPDVLVVLMPDGSLLASPTPEGATVRAALAAESAALSTAEADWVAARLRRSGYLVESVASRVQQLDPVRVYLATSSRPLESILRELNLIFLALVGVGVALAWLSGLVLSRPVTTQVDGLVAAIDRVASGDLGARVAVARDDDLGRVARAFNTMAGDLAENKEKLLAAERLAAWQEIARRLAHEIKNPLSPIQLSIETLRKCYQTGRSDFPEIMAESTTTILEEVARLRRIVQEFSDFARLPSPRLIDSDMNEVIRGVVSLYAGLDPRFTIDTDLASSGSRFVFDPDQMNRVFVNLVKNAVEAMPDGGEVHISSRRDGDYFAVTVADSGAGVSPEARARLFEPYATTKTGGTGLGLAIVHRIVSEHQGSIALDPSWTRGAAFVVTLSTGLAASEADA